MIYIQDLTLQLRIAASVPCDLFFPVNCSLSKWQVNHVVPEIETGTHLETRATMTHTFDETQRSHNILGDLWQLGIFQKSEEQWRGLRLKLQRFLGVSKHAASQTVLCIQVAREESTGRPGHGGHPVRVGPSAFETERTIASQPITRGAPHTQRLRKLPRLRHHIFPVPLSPQEESMETELHFGEQHHAITW